MFECLSTQYDYVCVHVCVRMCVFLQLFVHVCVNVVVCWQLANPHDDGPTIFKHETHDF